MREHEESRLLAGRYRLDAVVGGGGMAEVYSGCDVRLDRPVAVKALRADLADDATFVRRFRREAQAAASLSHPCIVAVYDTGEGIVDAADGPVVPYLVMEYVEGETLRELLARGEHPLPRRALEIIDEILAALDHSHQAGIVHRDITPTNVMLTTSGGVKVMDFGIARALHDVSTTGDGQLIGTADYLPPERARGEPTDPRSDLYSVGCVLYELLTGSPPFSGDSALAVADRHVNSAPVPPSRRVADLPTGVERIVQRALAKHPDQRHDSAAQMRAELQRVWDALIVPTRSRVGAVLSTSTRPAVWGTTLALIALVGLATTALAVPIDFRGGTTVPSLVGREHRAAAQDLRHLGLKVRLVSRYTAQAPKGDVYAQNPRGGSRVDAGGTVVLFVSRGSPVVTVPDGLVGASKREARAMLRQVGLEVGAVSTKASTKPANRVLKADPPGGASAGREIAVDLVVSTGPVEVPAVLGEHSTQAAAALDEAGLAVDEVYQEPSTEPAGEVLAADPAAGAEVAPGTGVDLIVSTGPVQVPSVVGEEADTAAAALDEAGLAVQTRTRRTASAEEDTVLSQQPGPGAYVEPGTTVTLVVAVPPPSPSPTPTPSQTEFSTEESTPTADPTTPAGGEAGPEPTASTERESTADEAAGRQPPETADSRKPPTGERKPAGGGRP